MDTNDKALQHIQSVQDGTQQPDLMLNRRASGPVRIVKFEPGQDIKCKVDFNFPGRHSIFAYKNEICTVNTVSGMQIELINAEGVTHHFHENVVRAYFSTH